MDKLECPYCEVELGNEEQEPNEVHERECDNCGKNFVYTIEYDPNYSASKADCLNDGEHDYQPIHGYPKEFYENRRRCSMCSDQIVLDN